MSAIERMLNRLEEKILARSDEVTGQESCRDGAWAGLGPSPGPWRGFSGAASIAGIDKIIEIFRLEETSEIAESNHSPITAKSVTNPVPKCHNNLGCWSSLLCFGLARLFSSSR